MTTTCQGWCKGSNPITHLGDKGYVYCSDCAKIRKASRVERVRKMRVWELRMNAEGKPLPNYTYTHKPKAA